MIRAALVTWVALNAAIPVALGTLRAAHERRYRRNVERIANVDPTWQSILTTRVGMAADLRETTGLAGEHFDEWDRELAWNEAD